MIAFFLDDVAQLLMATNQREEAETLMHRALAIAEAADGLDHPRVALRQGNRISK
jgi:hypothetical protein